MTDSLFLKTAQEPGAIARLKVGKPAGKPVLDAGLSGPEKQLADLIDLSPQAREKSQSIRKLDIYLRTFSQALKFFGFSGGASSSYRPQLTPVDIEIVPPKKQDTLV